MPEAQEGDLSSRATRGPLLILLGPILALGVAALSGAILTLARGGPIEDLIGQGFAALIFGAIGGGPIYFLWTRDSTAEPRGLVTQSRGSRPGEIRYSDQGSRNFFWFFSLGWSLILSLFVWQKGSQLWVDGVVVPVVMLGLFVLVALASFRQAIKSTLRYRRYGRSLLVLERFPVVPGDRLTAVLHTGLKERPAKPFQVWLRCERVRRVDERTGGGAARRIDHRRETLWERRDEIDPQKMSQGRFGLSAPIDLLIPSEPVDAAETPEGAIEWVLEVTDRRQSPRFAGTFTLPVSPPASAPRGAAGAII